MVVIIVNLLQLRVYFIIWKMQIKSHLVFIQLTAQVLTCLFSKISMISHIMPDPTSIPNYPRNSKEHSTKRNPVSKSPGGRDDIKNLTSCCFQSLLLVGPAQSGGPGLMPMVVGMLLQVWTHWCHGYCPHLSPRSEFSPFILTCSAIDPPNTMVQDSRI